MKTRSRAPPTLLAISPRIPQLFISISLPLIRLCNATFDVAYCISLFKATAPSSPGSAVGARGGRGGSNLLTTQR
jgi:hypothetical protein